MEGVQAIHAAGLVHRDLKPKHILMHCPRHVPTNIQSNEMNSLTGSTRSQSEMERSQLFGLNSIDGDRDNSNDPVVLKLWYIVLKIIIIDY